MTSIDLVFFNNLFFRSTRLIAIVPTFCVAFFSQIQDLTGMNDILNAVMALQLPFAVIPTIAFTSSHFIMGEFVNGIGNKIVSCILCVVVIAINIFFVTDQVMSAELQWGWILLVGKLKMKMCVETKFILIVRVWCYFSDICCLVHIFQHIPRNTHDCVHGQSESVKHKRKLILTKLLTADEQNLNN